MIATEPNDDRSVIGRPNPSMYAVRSLTYVTRWSNVHPLELNSHLGRSKQYIEEGRRTGTCSKQ